MDTTRAQVLGADLKKLQRLVSQGLQMSEDEVTCEGVVIVGYLVKNVLRTHTTLGELKRTMQALKAIPEAEAREAEIVPDLLAVIEVERKACAACWQSNTHRDTSDVLQQRMIHSTAEQASLRACVTRLAAHALCCNGHVRVTYCTRGKQAPCAPLPDAWHADWFSVLDAIGHKLPAADWQDEAAVLPKWLTVEVLTSTNTAE